MARRTKPPSGFLLTPNGQTEKPQPGEDALDEGLLLADGLDEAFLGIGRRCGQPDIAVYSIERAVRVLVKQGMPPEEALEYLEFNTVGAWVGPTTPLWVEHMTVKELRTLVS